MRFVPVLLIPLLLSAACSGASGQGQPATDALSQLSVSPVVLPEQQVPHEIKALLLQSSPSGERLNRLAGVVHAQLDKAGRYFASGNGEAGMQTTMGALLLIRSEEQRPEMFAGSTSTLLQAAEYVSRFGDEGRALALYQLAEGQLQEGPLKKEVAGHLGALATWQASSHEPGSMQAVGARHRSILNETLITPSSHNLNAALKSSIDWLNRALVEGQKEGAPTSYFEHDERVEARRAVMTAALGLAGLYLRDGDVGGALAALEVEPVASVSSDKLLGRLEGAQDGNPEAWADLFGLYESAGDVESGILSRELSRGASFGAAVGLYRLEPNELRAAIPLATLLVEHGMADVAPLVLAGIVDDDSDGREVDWVLRLVFGALSRAEQLDDLALARRVFDNSKGLIELSSKKKRGADDSPTAADFYHAMGALEARAGHLERARPHLEKAVALRPTLDALRLLAAIDGQRGDLEGALRSVEAIRALAQRAGDPVGEAQALLLSFDLQQQSGKSEAAAASLRQALELVQAAREQGRTGADIAISEAVFADVLERYGELAAAERATERAYEASQHHLGRQTMILLDASRRALTHGQLAHGRATLRRALDANLEERDLVYVALWTQLLQQKQQAPSDGSVEEALMRIEPSLGWAGVLREWSRGAISDDELLRQASGLVQKTEAKFYVLMSKVVRGQAPASVLEEIAKSAAVELIEVRIARDTRTAASGEKTPKFPSDAELP